VRGLVGGDSSIWQPLALFLGGVVASGVLMIIRGDFLGRRAAEEAERRLSKEIDAAEGRTNTRIDREMAFIGRELRDIKESLVRLENRGNA